MAMLFYKQWKTEAWLAALRAADPGVDIRVYPDLGEESDIEFALVWAPPAGLLASLPNLRAVQSIGAGVEHLFADPQLPPQLPIARVVDTQLVRHMTEYVVLHVLRQHRGLDRTLENQAARRWERRALPDASETTVGILGLGTLGTAAACALAALGFKVAGWSRTEKRVEGIECFAGAAGLEAFLPRCQHLVCLLPLTPATRGIVDAKLLAKLPQGAYFINVGRGAQVADADLLAALDSGQLAGATLDVFTTEPLPPEHPYWAHPRVLVTPHNSAEIDPADAALQVLENYRRVRAGQPVRDPIDREQGY